MHCSLIALVFDDYLSFNISRAIRVSPSWKGTSLKSFWVLQYEWNKNLVECWTEIGRKEDQGRIWCQFTHSDSFRNHLPILSSGNTLNTSIPWASSTQHWRRTTNKFKFGIEELDWADAGTYFETCRLIGPWVWNQKFWGSCCKQYLF